ncbi:hypothetical protein [Pusillimonas sp. NJUB218]|uniref:hypothetical protein n=1 Tax=Pusillimonas sp. NJUB218 TaxID=2023230 RepID=UPI000F4CF817|nr:hypothetical protein [Pusillimonas sp. NJUB218]ROT45047.1 hypothetical protein CHR62_09355 [Pusillimonas sp. NJUB218]
MAEILYWGVSLRMHQQNCGKLAPRGNKVSVTARYDGRASYDGTFTHGETETNTVHAHHIDSGLWGGAFISTAENLEVAKCFATSGGKERGIVYVLDVSRFNDLGIIMRRVDGPKYPEESEVSIRASDGGNIPNEAIVDVIEVAP